MFASLTKSHLSFDAKELQVWLGMVPATEIEQLCQLLSESLMSLLERKDTICDDIKEEMRIYPSHDKSESSHKRTQELLNALIDKDETDDGDELMMNTDFQISPLLWTLVKSEALKKDFKMYFQRCILATIVCQSDVESMIEHLLSIPDFDIFNSKQEVTQMLSAGQKNGDVFGDNPHVNFIQGLKNRQLLTIFKLSGHNGALKELLDQELKMDDLDLGHDQDILRCFDPMDWNESSGKFWLNQVILKVFNGPGTMDCNFNGKMLKCVVETLNTTEVQPNEAFEALFRAMSMSAKESKDLLTQLATSTRINKFTLAVLDLTLEKIFALDKWSLMSDDMNVTYLSNVVEQVLLDRALMRPTLLSKCQDLLKVNKRFLQHISATHLSLACQQRSPSSIALAQAILGLNFEAFGSHVQKWIKNNIHLCDDKDLNLLHPLIKQILAQDKCKRHFKSKVAQRILGSKSSPNQDDLELLGMLVVNHEFDLSEEEEGINALMPCHALFEHYKRKGDEDSILSKVILPLMNQCVKEVKSGQTLASSCKLLSKCLKDFTGRIEEDVTKFAKSMLKYSLKPEKDQSMDDDALLALCEVCEKSSEKGIQDMIYALITGHSQFIPIMLSSELSSKKVPLLKLILTLLKQDPSLCSSLQVPIYLGAYNATLSQVDQLLLEILQVHEMDASVSFQAFKPMVWGPNAIAKYSVLSQARQVSSKTSKVSEILTLFHPERMFNSALNCPNRFNEPNSFQDTLYDPRFVLPLICQLCSPNRFVDKHLKLIESGALAMAFASLSCRQEPIRYFCRVIIIEILRHFGFVLISQSLALSTADFYQNSPLFCM